LCKLQSAQEQKQPTDGVVSQLCKEFGTQPNKYERN